MMSYPPIGYSPDRHRTEARFRLVYGERRLASRNLVGAIPEDIPRVAMSRAARLADPRNRREVWQRIHRYRGVIAFACALAVWALAWALMLRAF